MGAAVLLVLTVDLGSEIHRVLLGVSIQIVSYDQTFVATQGQTLSEEYVSVATQESLDFWFGHSGQDATLVGTQDLLLCYGDNCGIAAQPVSHEIVDTPLPRSHLAIWGALPLKTPCSRFGKSQDAFFRQANLALLKRSLGGWLEILTSLRHSVYLALRR